MKILAKFINELDARKIFVRHFLDSMQKARLIAEKFGCIRLLNLRVSRESLAAPADAQLLDSSDAVFGPIVSFYSNLSQCRSVDVTPLANAPGDFEVFRSVSTQIKRVINPSLIIVLGLKDSCANARAFASEIEYCFLEGSEFSAQSNLESPKYFADALNKFVFQTRSEHLLLHLDTREFAGQWQILLFSLKSIVKTIFVDEAFHKRSLGFFKGFSFGGKMLEFSTFDRDFRSIFFKEYSNQFIVFDKDFPEQLAPLKTQSAFVVLDCGTIADVITQNASTPGESGLPP